MRLIVGRLVRQRGYIILKTIMSGAAEHNFPSARPPGFTGRGDKYLGEIVQELRRVLWKTQKSFVFPSCRLQDNAWTDVSALLVEWAEDVHILGVISNCAWTCVVLQCGHEAIEG